MKPADKIKRLFKDAELGIDPDADEKVFDDVLQARQTVTTKVPAMSEIWRILMKNPIAKIAVAAVITIACVTGILMWTGTGSGIALADVLTRIEQITAYGYKMQTTISRQKTIEERISTILVSQDHGIKITLTIDPNNSESQPGDTYVLPRQNSMVFIDHAEKTYIKVKFKDDAALEEYKKENNDPHTIIKDILSCDHTSFGKSVIDGIKVEGFQTTDPNYNGGFAAMSDFMGEAEKVIVKLWVDVKTLLPVRLVEDIVKKNGACFHEASYDFQWNVVVHDSDFEPIRPEGYISFGETLFPASTEENVIESLRLFVNLAGTYPKNIGSLIEEARKLTGYDPRNWREDEKWQNLSEDEKTEKNNELASITGAAFFYEELVKENKDPAYYGETVRPNDAEKVLMRWKLDNGQYRVIFGDLSSKTVTAEALAELEGNLPQ